VAEDNKNLAQGMINSPNVRSKQGEAKAVKDYEVVWASWPNVGMNEKERESFRMPKYSFIFCVWRGSDPTTSHCPPVVLLHVNLVAKEHLSF